MRKLSAAHLRLTPAITDARAFADPRRRAALSADLRELNEGAAVVLRASDVPGGDPLIRFSARGFAVEVGQAGRAFAAGDLAWARYALGQAGGYCIGCHTRLDRGPQVNLSWIKGVEVFDRPQRIDLWLANRGFDRAIDEAMALAVDSKDAGRNTTAWLNGIERVLAVLVRVRADHGRAEQLVGRIVLNPGVPYAVRSTASAWLRDIRDWQTEAKVPTPVTLERAVSLKLRADAYGPFEDRLGLILNLRASGALHELLERSKVSERREALLYAGLVTRSLTYLNLGHLDQFYFESCVRDSPHSDLAERCFDGYERSVREANPFLSLDADSASRELYRLEELRRLARVLPTEDAPSWRTRPWERTR